MKKSISQEKLTHKCDRWIRIAIAFEGKIDQYRKDIKKLQKAIKVAKEKSAQGVPFPGGERIRGKVVK